MRSILLFATIATLCVAQHVVDAGKRITPPTIRAVSPQGVSRGATVEMTIEGFNLARASAIYFSQPGDCRAPGSRRS